MYNRGFHYIFTWKIVLCLLLGLIVSNGLFYYIASKPLKNSYVEAFNILEHTDNNIFSYVLRVDAIILVLVGALIFFVALIMSHRISGPLYRFEQSAKSMAGGDLFINVRLRNKDEMKEVAVEMDEYFMLMRQKIGEMKMLSGEIKKTSEKFHYLDGGSEDNVIALKNGIIASHGRLKENLAFFKT
ncbi:MAG: hypothetical protein ACYDFU_09100 [Nitrospirota bacterium]